MSQHPLHDLAIRRLAAGERVEQHRDALALLQACAGDAARSTGDAVTLSVATGGREGEEGRDPAPSLLPPDADRALLLDFVSESRELLEQADVALDGLELDPDDAESIHAVFRVLHTLKGTSAFLALDCVTAFAHHAESLLSLVRDRRWRCTGETARLVVRSLDMLRDLLDAVQAAVDGHAEQLPDEYESVLDALRTACASADAGVGPAGASHVDDLRLAGRATPSEFEDVLRRLPDRTLVRPEVSEGAGAQTVRVRIDALDRLIELVGTLGLAESLLAQHPVVRDAAQVDLQHHVATSERIIRELQSLSMGMRMVPIQSHFQKVERLVRDLALRSGKRIEFVGEGEMVEIDRQVAERLGDPLLHMVRNAVDHGIELPADRQAAGKPEFGTIHLRAYRADDGVVLELHDDGRGLDRERIVRKALQQGHIMSSDGMSDAEVHELIFRPGFSTAERITDVSGRGVGMDVVRRNIEALRGRVDVRPCGGDGTTFRVQLPVTPACTDALPTRGDAPGTPRADASRSVA